MQTLDIGEITKKFNKKHSKKMNKIKKRLLNLSMTILPVIPVIPMNNMKIQISYNAIKNEELQIKKSKA